MRLHVAALPFPTGQGTQAIIRTMLEAESAGYEPAHLLTYGDAGYVLDPTFQVHRVPNFPRLSSQRSGPSLRKIVLDLRLAGALRACIARVEPSVLVAHHVEAAAVCLSVSSLPVVFFAHTDLGAELPSYAHPRLSRPLRWMGAAVDRWLIKRAGAVAAISPALASRMGQATPEARSRIAYVSPPWAVAPTRTAKACADARAELGLCTRARWLLYAGNLDDYQDWQSLPRALACLIDRGVNAQLLVATGSDPSPLRLAARKVGIGQRLRIVALGDEADRQRAHAAADCALVPRGVPGGLPIKLLDAMARGLPTIAMPHATAGLSVGSACRVAASNGPGALADTALQVLSDAKLADRLGRDGRAYVAREHNAARYLDAMQAVESRAMSCM